MTTEQKHEIIAAQYYKEIENAKAQARVHYETQRATDISYIKSWLKNRNCKTFTDYLDAEQMQ